RAVFAKGEPDVIGRIRGQRHTMLGDTDIDSQRHLRGAPGAVVAVVVGDGRVFVSGGAEH
ncbi:MAG TPA: ring-opening amidohydrolase, partial [Candidatus Limnocylindria bacterium]|nr:ring-opening amidohydrolase [Candidatus Limnocylindria bacterium]